MSSGLKPPGVARGGNKCENSRVQVKQPETLTEGSSFPGRAWGELGQETLCNFTAMKLAPDGSQERCLLPAGARHRKNLKHLPS